MKTCRQTPATVKIGPKYRTLCIETLVRSIVAADIESPWYHCCATIGIIILLAVTYNSTIHTVGVVAFPFQLWLRERATTLRYMYIGSRVLLVAKWIEPVFRPLKPPENIFIVNYIILTDYPHLKIAVTNPPSRTYNSTIHTVGVVAFPFQLWLRERATTLRCMYIGSRVLLVAKWIEPVFRALKPPGNIFVVNYIILTDYPHLKIAVTNPPSRTSLLIC